MKFLIAIFTIGILTGPLGHGVTIFENFQGQEHEFEETTTSGDYDFLRSLTTGGIQVRSSLFDTDQEEDYLSVWADEFSVKSEPPRRPGWTPSDVIFPPDDIVFPPGVSPIDRPVGVSR